MEDNNLLKPSSPKDHLKAFSLALMMVLAPLLLLEGLLRIFDPWGITFFDDMVIMANAFEPDDTRGYYLPDGVYEFSYWDAHMEDGVRILPEPSADATCRIVLLGDSGTFGYGVNDDEVWSYHLANRFPDIEFVNAGITAYNSYNVRQTYELFPDADGYFYTVLGNDWEPSLQPTLYEHENPARTMPYMIRYGSYALHNEPTVETDYSAEDLIANPLLARFIDDIAYLTSNPNLELLGFVDTVTTLVLQGLDYDVHILSYPDERNSVIDGHLNPAGNLRLADDMMPIMEGFIERHCPR